MQRAVMVMAGLMAACAAVVGLEARQPATTAATPAQHVVLVTVDGARWQDIFGGIDLDILKATSGETPVEQTDTYRRFWAATPAERRAKVMPFLWNRLVAQQGFIAGNRTIGSRMQVANTMKFSYPGYSELLTGAPHDDVITSNDNTRYPFLTVLEWLRADLKLPREGIAAYGSWETFNYIAEREEGAITINAGYEDFAHPDPEMKTLSALQHLTPNGFHGARHDIYTFRFGLAHLQTVRPPARAVVDVAAVGSRVPRHDHAHPHRGSRPGPHALRLDGPRREGRGRGRDLDRLLWSGRDRARRIARRWPALFAAGGRHHRRAPRPQLPVGGARRRRAYCRLHRRSLMRQRRSSNVVNARKSSRRSWTMLRTISRLSRW
jgi:hypothetical protein